MGAYKTKNMTVRRLASKSSQTVNTVIGYVYFVILWLGMHALVSKVCII